MAGLPPLRNWQELALRKWRSHSHKGCFEVATGGGKTTFALAALNDLRKTHPNIRTIVVVPTTVLLDQWFMAFVDDFGIDATDIKTLTSRDLTPDAPINLVIINTARSFNHQLENADEYLLIVDECHRAGSEQNSRSLLRGTKATIGLSATPYRDFDDGFERFIEPILGPILMTYPLESAISDGVLSNLSMTYVRIPLLPSEESEYSKLTRQIAVAMQNSSETLDVLLRKRARLYNSAFYRIPVATALMSGFRGRKTLAFLESIEMALDLQKSLDASGHSTAVYHSKMSQHLRRSNLRGFRRGIYDVLIACRALDEGFNVPEADLAVIVAGTSSRRQRTQRIGRVLRNFEGKTGGSVFTLYATSVEESRLLDESERLGDLVVTKWVESVHD